MGRTQPPLRHMGVHRPRGYGRGSCCYQPGAWKLHDVRNLKINPNGLCWDKCAPLSILHVTCRPGAGAGTAAWPVTPPLHASALKP
jgi:hypothetical protein